MSKKYTIPVTWEMFGTIEVEADSLVEAIEMVKNDEDKNGKQFSLPRDQTYSEGSFLISDGCETKEIENMYPKNKD